MTGPFGNPNAYSQLLAYAIALAAGLIGEHTFVASSGGTPPARRDHGVCDDAVPVPWSYRNNACRPGCACVRSGRRIGPVLGVTLALVDPQGHPLFVEVRLATDAGSVSAAAAEELTSSDESRLGAIMAGPALFATSPVFGSALAAVQVP